MKKKIVIAGGTGFIGSALIAHFSKSDDVVVLTRGNKKEKNNSYGQHAIEPLTPNVSYVLWDGAAQGSWATALEGTDTLINLCGKSVNCRYTAANKLGILNSRTQPTAALGAAILNCTAPPKLWINASSATIYRHATDRPQDELTGEIENDFSVQVCKAWEKSFFGCKTPRSRKVALHMAVTLGREGVMVPYLNLLKFGLGGEQGSGKQMYSWVHVDDIINIIGWVQQHEQLQGVYNCCSPHPVSNDVFMKTLRTVTNTKFGLPAPEWMLKIGAGIIGTETELLLKSRWVVPTKLLESGFQFEYPFIEDAFRNIVQNISRKTYHLI